MDIEFRLCHKSDLTSVAMLHKMVFKNFFLSSLGLKFLHTYHQTSFKSELSVYVCAVDISSNELVGFAHGTVCSKGFNKKIILQNKLEYLKVAMILLITNPMAILQLTSNLSKRTNPNDDGLYAELFTLGVAENYQGLGVGKELMRKFESELAHLGAEVITLTTDVERNDNAIHFYKKLGYSIFYEFITLQNRAMYRLQKKLEINLH